MEEKTTSTNIPGTLKRGIVALMYYIICTNVYLLTYIDEKERFPVNPSALSLLPVQPKLHSNQTRTHTH